MLSRKDQIRSHFDELSDVRDVWRSRNQNYYAADLSYMQFIVPKGSRILDLGCGTGDLLAKLEPSYGVGVDLSERIIDVAKRKFPDLKFFVGDVEDEAFISNLEGPFDYILLSDTIGYLDDIGYY